MVNPSVAITGLGLVTPAGIGVTDNWRRVCAGTPTAARDTQLAELPVDISCRVPDFDPVAQVGATHTRRLDRHIQFSIVALREALADAGLDPTTWDGARVAVVMGTGAAGTTASYTHHRAILERGPGKVSAHALPMLLPNMVAGQLGIECAARGPNLVTATACAAGTTAIGMARYLLMAEACDIAVAGGAEASLTPLFMAGFAKMRALSTRLENPQAASRPFDVDRDGFVAGEGAGILIMERSPDARARGARARAYLAGYGATADAYHVTSPHPEGSGTQQAMAAALADAGASADDVGHVNAHGTSTRLNDSIEGAALQRMFGTRAVITSTKGVTGHLFGATGAVEAAYTVLALENQIVPPTANLQKIDPELALDVATEMRSRTMQLALNNSCGFGGQNAALLFSRTA